MDQLCVDTLIFTGFYLLHILIHLALEIKLLLCIPCHKL